jgi:hypothetical protein
VRARVDGRRGWQKKGTFPPGSAPRLTDLEDCRRAWEGSQHPKALEQAMRLCVASGGVPPWLGDAVIWVLRHRDKARLRTYIDALTDHARYLEVMAAKRDGATQVRAYEIASERLAKTALFGGPDAMESSYKRARRRQKSDPTAASIVPVLDK